MREVGRAEHASTEQLSALLDGRAEPDEQTFLAAHVDRCVVCSHELAELRSVRDLLRALPVYLPPRSFTIPIAVTRPTRRFRHLIPLTRALGTVAAVLCVVLFSVDAMRMGYDAPVSVPDGAGAMHITTRATLESAETARPAEPRAAARAAAESAKPADAAPKIANAPAAPAAKPAAAAPASGQAAPAATQAPVGTPRQSIATTVTATPAGLAPTAALARPAESSSRTADAAASGPAENPAAAAAPQAAQQAPAAAAKPPAQGAPGAPQPTIAAFAPGQPVIAPTVPALPSPASAGAPGQAVEGAPPAPVQRPPAPTAVASPWLSPIRLWSLAFALIAATLLIASLVLSRISRTRTGARDEWTRS